MISDILRQASRGMLGGTPPQIPQMPLPPVAKQPAAPAQETPMSGALSSILSSASQNSGLMKAIASLFAGGM